MSDDEYTEKLMANGERIICYASGRQVLVPPQNVRNRLAAMEQDLSYAHAELKAANLERLRKARASLAEGDAVPPEKRPI